MIRLGIVGGSQPEIKAFLLEANNAYPGKLEFHVFDKDENIDDKNFWTYYKCKNDSEAALLAVKMVYNGDIDIIVKGLVSTHTLLKAVVNKEYPIKTQALLSHVAVFDLPKLDRKILLTDAGMNIQPSVDDLIEIVHNAVEVAINSGMKYPKIALLSAAENFNEKMPSSVLMTSVTEHFKNYDNAIVYGPLSLDLALSKESVQRKKFEGPVAGDADVIVVPNIDMGNAIYKSFTLFGGATAGGLIVGTKAPVTLTSRSDSIESKLVALDLAIKQVKVEN